MDERQLAVALSIMPCGCHSQAIFCCSCCHLPGLSCCKRFQLTAAALIVLSSHLATFVSSSFMRFIHLSLPLNLCTNTSLT